jgi:O-methyltransferase
MKLEQILNFDNHQIDGSIISKIQIEKLVEKLIEIIDNNIEGDVVEFGCYVGESSKYLMKTLIETNSNKKLFVYDSFEGLPELSYWEKDTGWRPGTLNTTEDILISNFKRNNLPIPYIHKDWFINIPEYKIPEKISFAFLDGDFYNSIYDSLSKIYDKVSDGGYILFHDYKRNDLPGVEAAIRDFFKERNINYDVQEITEQLGFFIKTNTHGYVESKEKNITHLETNNNGVTLVTGLWDLGRSNLTDGWSRSFDNYIEKFRQLLKVDSNMIIFGDENLKKIVFENRTEHNTLFVHRSLDWFKQNEYFDLIQQIRTNPNWYTQVGWLTESTQAKLEMYNPLVMSKMFLLHDAKILDRFNSEYMFWIDAGLTNTVHYGYFTHDKVIDKLPNYFNKFSFICFPYEANTEIHGFNYKEMNNIVNGKINKVARAGFFGGPKESISDINTIYYGLLLSTLKTGFMGTEESIFTLMCYKHSELINYFEIESNGLMGTFFENLKNENLTPKSESVYSTENNLDTNKVALYVITFNSPKQFEVLIQSMLDYDMDFIEKPKKFLLDNSTDLSTTSRYIELCNQYGFEHIKKDNIGIVGGRVFVAEHFEETGLDFYYWFEDDMSFYHKKGEVCRNGFPRYADNLYQKSLEIISKENFDFLKLNFSEFYGDNSVQWSWYNVPREFRQSHWPEKPNLPVQGLDPNAPKTEFKHIKTHKGVPYVSGEVYLCNWPIVLTKEGNYKCYLETKWAHPHEQTLMSYSFQETVKGKINPGILLMTPTEHNRFHHYAAELRKES